MAKPKKPPGNLDRFVWDARDVTIHRKPKRAVDRKTSATLRADGDRPEETS